MTISTYAQLQTAVSNWMHRADLTSYIADFIKQGESILNRKLRTVDMETVGTLTANPASRFLSLPTGFAEMQSLWCESPREEIFYVSPAQISEAITTAGGLPHFFTVKSNIEFDRLPGSAYSLECRYFKSYDIASDLTNTLLTNYPEIYLHAALAGASLFVVDDARLATFRTLLNEEIDELNKSEERKRGSGLAMLRTELSDTGFDIITGA